MACDPVGQGRLPEEAVFGLTCERCAGVSKTRNVDSGERQSAPKTGRTEMGSARSLKSAWNVESGAPRSVHQSVRRSGRCQPLRAPGSRGPLGQPGAQLQLGRWLWLRVRMICEETVCGAPG